jgi:IS30 family transposase
MSRRFSLRSRTFSFAKSTSTCGGISSDRDFCIHFARVEKPTHKSDATCLRESPLVKAMPTTSRLNSSLWQVQSGAIGKNYNQLDLDERVELIRLRDAGFSFQMIRRLTSRSHTTISREWRRNSPPKAGYKPASADRMAYARCKRGCMLQRLSTLRNHVHDHLAMGWSPEKIAERLGLDGSKYTISHATIYRYIYRPCARKERLYRYLPHAKAKWGRRYFERRREPLPAAMNIANRPQAIEGRTQFGHWEGDLMQFRKQRGAVLNVCERISRYTLLRSVPNKRATNTALRLSRCCTRCLPKHDATSLSIGEQSCSPRHSQEQAEQRRVVLRSS